jgi:DNA-directed RNA polymerase specialized sigma24 family protein
VTAGLAGDSQTDATVIGQSLADPERFATIFERYFGQIRQYLARRVGTKIADDLAAEVFVVAFAERQRYDLARNCARPWLYGIATNLAGSHRRREERHYRALARADARLIAPSDEDVIADRVSASAAGRRWPARSPRSTAATGTCCCWWPWPISATPRSQSRLAFPTARCAHG